MLTALTSIFVYFGIPGITRADNNGDSESNYYITAPLPISKSGVTTCQSVGYDSDDSSMNRYKIAYTVNDIENLKYLIPYQLHAVSYTAGQYDFIDLNKNKAYYYIDPNSTSLDITKLTILSTPKIYDIETEGTPITAGDYYTVFSGTATAVLVSDKAIHNLTYKNFMSGATLKSYSFLGYVLPPLTAIEAENPIADDYIFDRWTTDGVTNYVQEVITTDLTLYAKYNKVYKVTYYVQDVEYFESRYKTLSFDNVKTPTAPAGYMFMGWSTDGSASGIITEGKAIKAETKLYAVFLDSYYYNQIADLNAQIDNYISELDLSKAQIEQLKKDYKAQLAEYIAANGLYSEDEVKAAIRKYIKDNNLVEEIESDSDSASETKNGCASGINSDGFILFTVSIISAAILIRRRKNA